MSRGLPYRAAARDAVRPGAWLMEQGEELEPLPSVLFTWDYGTDLQLERDVDIDVPEIRRSAGLAESAALSLDVVWRADRHMRGHAATVRLEGPAGAGRRRLRFTLPGRELGSVLALETCIRLYGDASDASGPSARRAGSVLWSETYRSRLKGEAARFPMALVDPVAHGHDPRIPWFLDIRPDLEAPAVGAVNLLVNREHPRVARALEQAGEADGESAAILSAMYHDLGRTLIDFALGRPELWEGDDFEEESFGRSLRALCRLVFPREGVAALREMRDSDPTAFAAECAVALRLMRAGFDA